MTPLRQPKIANHPNRDPTANHHPTGKARRFGLDGAPVHRDEAAAVGARRPENHRPTPLTADRTVNATHLAVLRSDQHTPYAAPQRMPIYTTRRRRRLRPATRSAATPYQPQAKHIRTFVLPTGLLAQLGPATPSAQCGKMG